jgi:hypothetical protein
LSKYCSSSIVGLGKEDKVEENNGMFGDVGSCPDLGMVRILHDHLSPSTLMSVICDGHTTSATDMLWRIELSFWPSIKLAGKYTLCDDECTVVAYSVHPDAKLLFAKVVFGDRM